MFYSCVSKVVIFNPPGVPPNFLRSKGCREPKKVEKHCCRPSKRVKRIIVPPYTRCESTEYLEAPNFEKWLAKK
jgi:hypothetical protein